MSVESATLRRFVGNHVVFGRRATRLAAVGSS